MGQFQLLKLPQKNLNIVKATIKKINPHSQAMLSGILVRAHEEIWQTEKLSNSIWNEKGKPSVVWL